MYDAHIHLDQYSIEERQSLFNELRVDGMVAVSMNLASCIQTQKLARQYPSLVYPAYGFHPEQPLPDDLTTLFDFIQEHHTEMVAIGEVGLPYYTAQQYAKQGRVFDTQPYINLLKQFISLAVALRKPVVLHAVHEDAAVACNLLEEQHWQKAHFHWYKGDDSTTDRMIRNGYHVSITPDIFYRERTKELVRIYPLAQMMVETDGPWQHEGAFAPQMTHPNMVIQIAAEIARIKELPIDKVSHQLHENTRYFYQL